MYVDVDIDLLIDKIYISPLATDYFRDAVMAIINNFNIETNKIVYSVIYNYSE
jgi:hypothetical protein